MKKAYETFNTKHPIWSRYLKGPMGAIVIKNKVHYEHPKDFWDNDLERRLEELATIIQWYQYPLFPVLYLVERAKCTLKYGRVRAYGKNKFEVEAKIKARRWLAGKNHEDYKDLTEDQYLDIMYYQNGFTRIERHD